MLQRKQVYLASLLTLESPTTAVGCTEYRTDDPSSGKQRGKHPAKGVLN
jgi:hypothetical protein